MVYNILFILVVVQYKPFTSSPQICYYSPEVFVEKKVLVFGTFDVIHPGHKNFLTQARALGDRLVASVARDSFVRMKKRRVPVHDENERRRQLLESGLVDDAILGDEKTGAYSILFEVKPDVVCFGHDQDELRADLTRWIDEHRDGFAAVELVTLKAFKPEIYKSSKLNYSEAKKH